LPALIFKTKDILPPGKTFFFWPSKMELHFLPPVAVNKSDEVEALKQKLHNMMSEYYVEHNL